MAADATNWVALPGSDIALPPGAEVVDARLPGSLDVFVLLPADPDDKPAPTPRLKRGGLGKADRPDPFATATPGPVTAERLKAVIDHAQAYGLKRVDFGYNVDDKRENAALDRRKILFNGTAEDFGRAFAARLRMVSLDGARPVLCRQGPVFVPPALAGAVEAVIGLDERPLGEPAVLPKVSAAASFKPSEIAAKYNFPPPIPAGPRPKVAVLEFGGRYWRPDIDAFLVATGGAPLAEITQLDLPGATYVRGDNTVFDVEVTLDIDVVAAIVPNPDLVVISAPRTEAGWLGALTAVRGLDPDVVSISWGMPETKPFNSFQWTRATMLALAAEFAACGSLGITVVAASGDHGSACGVSDRRAHVLYPASDPHVLACGGTTIGALGEPDRLWPSTGGGISDVFALPVWQQGFNTVLSVNDGLSRRGVPDVAGFADLGFPIKFTPVGGAQEDKVIGGTSATAPLYAGLFALIDQALSAAAGTRQRVGAVSEPLYDRTLTPAAVFRDVADPGANNFSMAPGYASRVGWDPCTGLGVVDGATLLAAWS
jgi:kumamolisin